MMRSFKQVTESSDKAFRVDRQSYRQRSILEKLASFCAFFLLKGIVCWGGILLCTRLEYSRILKVDQWNDPFWIPYWIVSVPVILFQSLGAVQVQASTILSNWAKLGVVVVHFLIVLCLQKLFPIDYSTQWHSFSILWILLGAYYVELLPKNSWKNPIANWLPKRTHSRLTS